MESGPNTFTLGEHSFGSSEFHALESIYINRSGVGIDIRFLMQAKAIVVKNNQNEIVGGFFVGKENLEKEEMKIFVENGVTPDSLYITGMVKDGNFGKEYDLAKILLNWTREFKKKTPVQLWGIVEKENPKLLTKYKNGGAKIIEIKKHEYDLVIF